MASGTMHKLVPAVEVFKANGAIAFHRFRQAHLKIASENRTSK
jgi:hypothetical protein